MSPLWGFGYLVCGVFYKHAAPLGLNAAQLVARYLSWGRGHLVQRVGEPNPYGFKGMRQYHIALLWSAGIGRVALL